MNEAIGKSSTRVWQIAAPSSAARTPGPSWADDEAALVRLWREKRGEVEPEDLSGNLIVQLGAVTEDLNRRWYEAQYRAGHHRHPATGPTSGSPVDGGDPGRPGRGQRGGVRSQVHAAVVILGGRGRREVHAAAAAQHVGGGGKVGGALGHYRGRQVGGDHRQCRPALPAPHRHRGAQVLALCRER